MATEFSVPLLGEKEEDQQEDQQQEFSVPLLNEEKPTVRKPKEFEVPLLGESESDYSSAFRFRGGTKLFDGVVMAGEQGAQLPGRMLRSAENAAIQDLIDDINRSLGEGDRSFVDQLLLRGSGYKYNYEKAVLENKIGLADRGNLGILWNTLFGEGDISSIKKAGKLKNMPREDKIKLREELYKEANEHAQNTIEINKKYNEKKQKLWDERGYTTEEIAAIGGVSSLSVSLASMGAAVFTKKPQLAYATLPYFGLVTQQESYEDGIARGLSDADARKNSYLQGGSEVATELLTQFTVVRSLSKYFKGQKQTLGELVREGGVIFLAEGAGEQINTLAQSTFDAMYDSQDELRIAFENRDNPLYTGTDYKDILWERARLTSISSLVAGGGIVTANGAIKYGASKDWIKNSSNPEQTKQTVDDLIMAKELEKVAFEQASIKSLNEDNISDPNVDPMENLAEEILKIEMPPRRSEQLDDTTIEESKEPKNVVKDINEGLLNVEEFLKGKGYDVDKLNLTIGKDAKARINNEPPNTIKLLNNVGFVFDKNNVEATANKIDQFILDQGAKKNFIPKPQEQIKDKISLPKKFVPQRARDFAAVSNLAAKAGEVQAALGNEKGNIPRSNRTYAPGNPISGWEGEIDSIGEALWEQGFRGESTGELTDRPTVNETLQILEENRMLPKEEAKYFEYTNTVDNEIYQFIQRNPNVSQEDIKKAAGRASIYEIADSIQRLQEGFSQAGDISVDNRTGEERYFVTNKEESGPVDMADDQQSKVPDEYEDYMAMLKYDEYFESSQGMPVIPEHERYVPAKPALKPNKPKKPLVVDDGEGGSKNLDGGSNITDDSWGIGYESRARQIKNELEFYIQNVVGRVKDVEKARDRRAEEIGEKRLTIAEKPSETFARMPGVRNSQYRESLEEVETIIEMMRDKKLYGNNVDLVARAMHAPERNKKIYADKQKLVDDYIEQLEGLEADRVKRKQPRFDPNTGEKIVGLTKAEEKSLDKLKQEAAVYQNNGSGIQTDEAYNILRKFGIAYENNEFVAMNEKGQAYLDTVAEYHKYIKRTVDLYDKSGLIDEAVAEDYRSNANYKYYVPLSGFAADTNVDGKPNKKGKGVSVVGKENEKAKGRTSLSDSPLLQMSLQRQRAIDRSTKNEALINLADLVRDQFDNSDIASVTTFKPQNMDSTFGFKENGEQKYLQVNDERLTRALNAYDAQFMDPFSKMMGHVSRIQSALYTTLSPAFILYNFSRDLIAGGIALYTEQNLPGGRAEGKRILGKSMRNVPKRLGQFYKGLRGKEIKEEGMQEAFELFDKYGASSGFVTALRQDAIAEHFDQLKKQHDNVSVKEVNGNPVLTNLSSGAKAGLDSSMKFMGDLNSAVENGIRFSSFVEFIKAENNGKISGAKPETIKQAASLAKQLTIDYTTKGHIGAAANSHFIFFNAAAQSNIPLYRALGKNAKLTAKVGGGIASSAALITLYNFLVSDEDETGRSMYQNLSDRFGNRYIIVMLPNLGKISNIDDAELVGDNFNLFGGPVQVNGRTVAMAYPQPLGFNIPYNISRNAIETTAHEIFDFDRPQKTVGRAALDMFDNVSTGVMPIGVNVSRDTGAEGFAKTAVRTITPTYIKPLTELAVNENFFGAPITKEYLGGRKDLPNSSVVTAYDNDFYIGFARFLNTMSGGDNEKLESGFIDFQPGQLEYIVNYYGGGPMSFLNRTYNQIHRAVFDEVRDISKTPIFNTYMIQEQDGVYARRYYDAIQDIEGKVVRYKTFKESNPKLAQEYLNENKSVIALDYISEFDEQIRKQLPKEARGIISKKMTDIRNKSREIRDAEKTLVSLNLYRKNPTRWYEKTEAIKESKRSLYIDLLKEYEKAMTEDRNREKEEQD